MPFSPALCRPREMRPNHAIQPKLFSLDFQLSKNVGPAPLAFSPAIGRPTFSLSRIAQNSLIPSFTHSKLHFAFKSVMRPLRGLRGLRTNLTR
jgi:hypothetical protein